MLEELYSRKSYPKGVAEKIEAMGAIAMSVANRWMLGWPERVKALLKAETYLGFLESQVEQEKDVLAKEWRNKNQIPFFVEWQRILHERDWDVALSTGEHGNHLRKFSPCACTLPDEIRLEILRQCRNELL